ncbi:hypothetical protein N7447_004756 [Penicillium robsamsonii]|uniref:uncharacterized protein n=1 Tax=Penicillium robsamsonii TaxID=1792511 RepID=UPI00254856E3|nr:uncharacterized protein N7447_004756 [Penicillium robsamsonii]KAJ5822416.1 hypothetical protein N7447_004756 [Penicillium robsamsonii]
MHNYSKVGVNPQTLLEIIKFNLWDDIGHNVLTFCAEIVSGVGTLGTIALGGLPIFLDSGALNAPLVIYGWPRQSWRIDPAPMANAADRPYDSQPVVFQRGFLGNDTSPVELSDPPGVCLADLRSLGNGKQDDYRDLDYDSLLFVDLDGKPVDVRIVLNENGKAVDMYVGDPDAGPWTREALKSSNSDKVTADPTTVTIMTGVPAGSESRPTIPYDWGPNEIGKRGDTCTLMRPEDSPYVPSLESE